MPKRRIGLHKDVSSIFDGVPIPKEDGAQKQTAAPAAERPGDTRQKTPAPSHLTSKTPKPQQPAPTPPKAAPAPPPKAAPPKPPRRTGSIIKTTRQPQWQQKLEQIKNKLFASKPGLSTTRQKTMTILIPVLFIVLIFVLTQVLSTPSRSSAKTHEPESTAALAASTAVKWQTPEPYLANLRDPMQFGPAAIGQATAGGLIIKGIVYSEDNPSAVIDDKIVHEGDKVFGATILKINKDSVDFEMEDKKWTQKVQR